MAVIDLVSKYQASANYEMNNHTYTFVWDAYVDNIFDTCDTVRVYYFNTVLNGQYFYNGTCLKTIAVNQVAPLIFQLTATFATLTPWETEKRTTPPLDRRPVVDTQTDEIEVICDMDVDGVPLVNSAGDPFIPAPVKKAYLSTIRVTRNFGTWLQLTADTYKGTTNANGMFGFPPGALLCTECTAKQTSEVINSGGQDIPFPFWESTWVFKSNTLYPWFWKLALMNKGMRQIIGSAKQPCYVDTVSKSVETSEPVFLAGDGQQLPTGTPPGAGQVLIRGIYPSSDFSSFDLEP